MDFSKNEEKKHMLACAWLFSSAPPPPKSHTYRYVLSVGVCIRQCNALLMGSMKLSVYFPALYFLYVKFVFRWDCILIKQISSVHAFLVHLNQQYCIRYRVNQSRNLIYYKHCNKCSLPDISINDHSVYHITKSCKKRRKTIR